MTKPDSANKRPPGEPLSWPDHFPPSDRWQVFFISIRLLQAARSESLMSAWTDPEQRSMAGALGKCLQRELEWKTPWFIPVDAARAVIGGPDFDNWNELDLWDLFIELDEQVGTKRGPKFWNSLVNWEDKRLMLGEVVRKLAEASDVGKDASGAGSSHPQKTGGLM